MALNTLTTLKFLFYVSFIVQVASQELGSELNQILKYPYESIFNNSTQNQECADILGNLSVFERLPQWAMQMLDSTGKVPSGLMTGNIMSLGDYDQCITINDEETGIRGKYCVTTYNFQENISSLHGVCLPDVCNFDEFVSLVPLEKSTFVINDYLCQTDDGVILDNDDIFCITLIVITTLFMLSATCYDLHVRKQGTNAPNGAVASFSIYTNTINLLKKNPNDISCVYGLRVFSMLWIIYANRANISMKIPAINSFDLLNQKFSDSSNYIYSAHFAVDTFFYLSGFMMAYNTLKNGTRMKILNMPRFIFQRLLRIFPTMVVLFIIIVTISRRVGSGPIYQLGVQQARQSCLDHWLSYFFFFQNYSNPDNMCLPQTWYIAAVMQMHVLTPLILIPLGNFQHTKKAWTIHIMFMSLVVSAMFIPMIVAMNENNSNIYSTHSRFAIFLLGIYAGSKAINVDKHMKKINKIIYFFIWILILILMASIAYPARYLIQEPNSMFAIMLATFGRPLWGVCLTWIIFNCLAERCEMINRFLSHPIFKFVSHLCFSMFVLNNLEIGYHAITARNPIYIDHVYLVRTWISDVFLTMFFAYLWSMLFELPLINLYKTRYNNLKKNGIISCSITVQNP